MKKFMTMIKVSKAGRGWAIIAACAAGVLLAAALRFGLLENEAQDLMCRAGGSSGWCVVRSALGWSIHFQLFGLAALALGIAAWLPGARRLAYAGLLVAGCGLLLYNSSYAAVALVVALLAALRPIDAA